MMTSPSQQPIETRTKIVATIGPSCRTVDQLVELVMAGVDVFRINAAHGTQDDHDAAVAAIRQASQNTGRPIATLVDLSGPKIRLGELFEDPTRCHFGATYRFVRGDTSGAATDLTSNYERLIDELAVGNRIMLADGTVGMVVTKKTSDFAECQVTAAGTIRSRQGINLPGAVLSVPAMTERDIKTAKWAASAEVDFVGLSFVRSPDDVVELKNLLRANGSLALVVAKIEKPEALDRLEEIVSVSNVVMVARGDLGVEIDIADTPVAQKRIIQVCQRHHKPVIVATQMLDSMTHASQPTRAEATDVANAILDGADACMLSGETAVGDHPTLVVETMNRIMHSTELLLLGTPSRSYQSDTPIHPVTSAIVHGAAQIAHHTNAKLVVVATQTGTTALVKSKQRDFIHTIGVSSDPATLRRMCLFWGIRPVEGAPVLDHAQLSEFIEDWGIRSKLLSKHDRIVFVTGSHVMAGVHNMVVVHEVR